MKSYYQILEINSKATQDEIKKAYRKLAKKLHPDLNPNDKRAAELFSQVQTAYETLSDEDKRQDYDKKIGHSQSNSTPHGNDNNFNNKQTNRSNSTNSTSSTIDFEAMHNSFESFFGFNPQTGNISNEEKLNMNKNSQKNPLDMTDMFESFMGFKK